MFKAGPGSAVIERHSRVALCGFYAHGNFGDDLMAVLIGWHLQQQGVDVSVLRLCEPYAKPFGFRVVDSISQLLEGVDLVVFGAGSMLVPQAASWVPAVGMIRRDRMQSEERSRLLQELHDRHIPFCVVSVGGDGRHSSLSATTLDTLRAAQRVSVRNPEDLLVLERIQARGQHFPDIVWLTSEVSPIPRARNKRYRVGVDIYWGNIIKQGALYLPMLIWMIARHRTDVDFVFIDTSNRSRNTFRALGGPCNGNHIKRYQFQNIEEDLELIASLDLVVSTRLHLGVACLSYGIPFISLFGERKTQLFMENAKLPHLYFRHARMPAFLKLMLSKQHLRQFLEEFHVPHRARFIEESRGHLNFIDDLPSVKTPG